MKHHKSILILTVGMIIAVLYSQSVSHTIAWMTKLTSPVENIFTYGKVDIELTETDTLLDEDSNITTNAYLMDLLNKNISKDALITVSKGSESCFVFVKLTKTDNFDEFIAYETDDNWIVLNGYTDVYYIEVEKKSVNQKFYVFKDKQVKLIQENKDELNQLTDSNYPKIEITGYAIQKEGLETPIEAWSVLLGRVSIN